MKTKKKFYRSRKGVTLVELIVGMAIIVIVFSGVVWGIAHGYATTVNNVTVDKASAKSQAITDDVSSYLRLYKISCPTDFDNPVDPATGTTSIKDAIADDVFDATGGAVWVDDSVFYDSSEEMKYTIITDYTTSIADGTSSTEIKGCVVKSAVLSTNGFIITTEFIPYA